MNTNKLPPSAFAVANDAHGPWDGPGIERSNDGAPWTTREHLNGVDHSMEVAHYLDDDGESDWFVRWPDGRIERVSYAGESKGFCDEDGEVRSSPRRRRS